MRTHKYGRKDEKANVFGVLLRLIICHMQCEFIYLCHKLLLPLIPWRKFHIYTGYLRLLMVLYAMTSEISA
jgi:hypothetical protein